MHRHTATSLRSRLATCAIALLAAGCDSLVPDPHGILSRSVLNPEVVAGPQVWTAVTLGTRHTCGLASDSTAHCWGANDFLQTGTTLGATCFDRPCIREPAPVGGGLKFVAISAGDVHTCALDAGGVAWCWGGGHEDGNGTFLGDGTIKQSADPIQVLADSVFTTLVVGGARSCALTASGQLWCWGRNFWGSLGNGSQSNEALPAPIGGSLRFSDVALAREHGCALTLGAELYCWGHNPWGQLVLGAVPPNNLFAFTLTPSPTQSTGPFDAVALTGEASCVLRSDGQVACAGGNAVGELGDGTDVSHRGQLGDVTGGRSYTQVVAGGASVCARDAGGASFCWGDNYFGTLGNGRRSDTATNTPQLVRGGPFSVVAIGGSTACGLTPSGKIFCWGDKLYGATGS